MDYTEQLKEMGFEEIGKGVFVIHLPDEYHMFFDHNRNQINMSNKCGPYLDLSHLSIDQLKQLVELLKPVK